MNFLKNIFGGGEASAGDMVIYVRPKMCKEVLRLEIDLKNQLSLNDMEDGYTVRKVANNPHCPFEVEVVLHFDKGKKLINREITNGEFVTAAEYISQSGE